MPALQPNRRQLALALLAGGMVLLAIAWLHPEVCFRGQVYSSADAQAAAAFQSLGDGSDGEFPHWNPFVFTGMPSYASLAYNPGAYPLTTPIRVLRDALGLPPMLWLLVHLAIAGFGTTGWVRWRGGSWAAAIAAGCWVVALPKLVAWGAYGHGTKLGTFAWLPLVGWCSEALLRGRSLAWGSGLAFAMGMMLLRGHAQIAYYAVLFVGVLVVSVVVADWRDPAARSRALRRTGWIAAAGLLALAVSLVLYLPVLEYQSHSIRGAAETGGGVDFDFATNWSLSWSEFATMWWPAAAGYGRESYVGQMPFTDYPNYIGLPLLILALAGALHRRDRVSRALVAIVLLATLLALGRNFFLYRIFFEVLPGFRKFRVPVMILAVQHLVIILLAARGADAVFSSRLKVPRAVAVLIGLVGLLGVVAGTIGAGTVREMAVGGLESMARGFGRPVPPALLLNEIGGMAARDALRLGAIFLASAGALLAVQMGRLPGRGALALVALLVFLDLWRVDQPIVHREDHLPTVARGATGLVLQPSPPALIDAASLEGYTEESGLARWLKSQEPRPRVFPVGALAVDNRLAAQRVVSLGGYHAAKLKLYEDVRARLYDPRSPQVRLARTWAARWLVAPQELGEQTVAGIARLGLELDPEPVYRGEGGVAYGLADPVARVRVVSSFSLEVPGEDTTGRMPPSTVLDRVAAAGFDPTSEAVLSAMPVPAPVPGAEAASVALVEEGYNYWTARVDLPAPGILVVADPWYPEWGATVDGEPVKLLRANYAQQAIALEAGVHDVEFRYRARSYVTGQRIAGAGWLLILAGLVAPPLFRARRSSRHNQEAQ